MKRTAMRRGKPKRRAPHSQEAAFPKPTTYPFNPEFLAWLRTQNCVSCGDRGSVDRIEAAHLDSCCYGDEENAVSLCGSSCHREGKWSLHRMGHEKFQQYHQVNLRRRAREQFAEYQAEQLCDTFMRV